jgi:CRP-like cAMP-binding protein
MRFNNGIDFSPVLRKLRQSGRVSDATCEALFRLPFSVRSLRAHDHVVRTGENVQSCFVLLSGFAHRYKIVAGGSRQIVALHLPGDFIDLQSAFLGRATHGLQMMTPGDTASVPLKDLQEVVARHPELQQALWVESLVDLSNTSEWVTNVGRRDARSRIAHLLCEFASRLKAVGMNPEREFTLPMSQEQIADATGLTSVHVNRTLQELGRSDLIRRKGRSITVPDWQALADTADFDPGYLSVGEPAQRQSEDWPVQLTA